MNIFYFKIVEPSNIVSVGEKSHFTYNSDSASDSALEDKLDDEGIPEALDYLNDFVSNLREAKGSRRPQ